MNAREKKIIIGVSAYIDFVRYRNLKTIPGRVDTGARTSSLWATDIRAKDGMVRFKMFGPSSPWYTGKIVALPLEGIREVTSSTGHTQARYMVKLGVVMHGQRLKTLFTLSNRETQTYPILLGRNTLRNCFLIDCSEPGEAAIYKDPTEQTEYNESEIS